MFQLKRYQQFAALIVGGILSIAGVQYVATPPPSNTGAPGEATCTSCHAGTLNSGMGRFEIGIGSSEDSTVSVVLPDSEYVIGVAIVQAGRQKFGFQLTALDGSGNKVGTFLPDEGISITPGTVNQIPRQYAGHVGMSTTSTEPGMHAWTVRWKAPEKLPARVFFYASGNAANGNRQNSGDLIYTDSLSVDGDPTSRVTARQLTNFSCAPNPSNGQVKLRFAATATEATKVQVMNTAGMLMFNQSYNPAQSGNQFAQTLDLDYLPAGIYTLIITHGGQSYSERLVIQ
jgi:hypothetical protein